MEEGLQGLLMGAVLVMFLIAMESALQVVDSSEALEQTVEERMSREPLRYREFQKKRVMCLDG